MKEIFSLMSLNAYDARLPLYLDYIRECVKGGCDILCLQEVLNYRLAKDGERTPSGALLDHFSAIEAVMAPEFSHFATRQKTWRSSERKYENPFAPWGIATFLGREQSPMFEILEVREVFLLGFHDSCQDALVGWDSFPVVLLSVKVRTRESQKVFWICNIHGYYAGKGVGKGDNPKRIEQSEKLSAFLRSIDDPWILCGDFNLRPDGKSLDVIRQSYDDVIDLIGEYGVMSTRVADVYGKEKTKAEPYADYVFTRGVKVEHFHVVTDQPFSDHGSMHLKFSL